MDIYARRIGMKKVYPSMEAAAADRATQKFMADARTRGPGTYTATQTGAKQTANLREQANIRQQLQQMNRLKGDARNYNRRANRYIQSQGSLKEA